MRTFLLNGAIPLHYGHLASGDAMFFLATLVYVPVSAIALVAAMEMGAGRGVRMAQRFVARYERVGPVVKGAAFLMIVSSSIDLGYVPSHLRVEPVASALFSLDAAALVSSSLLVVARPELRPAAVILLLAGMLAYALGGVQLDVTILAAKGVEALAVLLVVIALVRSRFWAEPEALEAPPVLSPPEPVPLQGRARRRSHRARAAGKPSRRRAGRRAGA